MKTSAVNSSEQQINMKGKLILLGNISANEYRAIESFMNSVADGITNRKVITQKPYDIYISKPKSHKNRLQIYGVYEQRCHEYPSVQFNLLNIFYNSKSSKPNTTLFRTKLNKFEKEKFKNRGRSNNLDGYILNNMRKSNRQPADGYSPWEKLLIAVRNKF